MNEMHRIICPGGVFLVTLHSEHAFSLVTNESERRRLIGIRDNEFTQKQDWLGKDGFVWLSQPVGSEDIDTTQFGISFIRQDYFANMVQDKFEVLNYVVGDIGGWQDMAILRKR